MQIKILTQGPPVDQATNALIVLHGRGGSANNSLAIADLFRASHTHVIAPEAPGHTWYPYSFLVEEAQNEPYLSQSIQTIKEMIESVAEHIPKEKIYLMGFSQGACLSLEISARFATRYGGVIAFTGGLIGSQINPQKYAGSFEGTPIYMSNGDNDPHIPLVRSEESKIMMEKLGGQVTLQVFKNREHTISKEEIVWVKNNYPF